MAMPNVPAQIRTYGDLKNAVSLWIDRDDDEFVNQIPNFINFAEKELYRNLRIPAFEREEYLRIVDGMAFIPSDLLEVRYIMSAKNGQMCRVTSPEEVDWLKRNKVVNKTDFNDQEIVWARTTGRFMFYPAINSTVPNTDISTNGDPDGSADGAFIISYYADPVELVNDTDTNITLTVAPEVLLYLALKHACLFVQDDNGVQKWAALASGVISEINAQNERFEYSGSPLVIPNSYGNLSNHQRISYNYARI